MTRPAFFRRSELTAALWSFRREFLLTGLFSAVANLLMLTPTVYMLQIYDRVLVSRSELTLAAVSLIGVFLLGIMAVSEWTRSQVLVRAGVRLDEQLGTRVFNASFRASLAGADASPARAFGDLLQVRQFLTGQGVFAFFDAPWTPIYLVVVFLLHPLLGALAIAFACAQLALAWFGHRQTVAPAQAAARSSGDLEAYLQGKLRNAEVLESMGMVANLRQRWRTRHERALAVQGQAQAVNQRVMAWSKFIRYSQQSLSLGAGALLVIEGQLTPGGMIAASVLIGRTLAPIDMLVGNWRTVVTAYAAFGRLEALLQRFAPQRSSGPQEEEPTGAIELRNVVARAPGREQAILKNIGFSVPAGTVVALLGPSGSGKSTLARAMVGIWPDLAGEVLLDGRAIGSWDRRQLGPRLGYLPQDVELFAGTVAENIARLGAIDSAQVIAAARCAGLHEMILRLPAGYDTPIGEGGALLSAGQRQRIALARAVYGEPALVVLDEPNANLDDAGEAALMATVAQLKARGKTVMLITHRPLAVGAADWLLLLNQGELVASGTREQVLAAIALQHTSTAPPTGASPLAPQPA